MAIEQDKLIVPPFNKKDIETIVNNGVASGEISVLGGTKLYKHRVVFEDGEHDQYTIVVISTSQQQITSQTFYNDVVSVSNAYKRVSISMSINVLPAYVYGVEGSQQSGKAQFTYLIDENNSVSISTGYAMSIVSDTVIEL